MAMAERQTFAHGAEQAAGSNRLILGCFIFSLILPLGFLVAGFRVDPTRLVAMFTIIPFAAMVYGGRYGPVRGPDILLPLYGIWVIIALVAVHGFEQIDFGGIAFVEVVGAYLIGRVLVRDLDTFKFMLRLLMWCLAILFPLVIYELLTQRMLFTEIFGGVFDVPQRSPSARTRLNLQRIQTVFDHPILFGLFCSMLFGNAYIYFRNSPFKRFVVMGFIAMMTLFSLSSAPLLALALQLGLIVWGIMTKDNFKLFLGLAVFFYITIDLLSNRTPITIMIDMLVFEAGTAWTRVITFRYAQPVVLDNPIFGIGFNDWPRPHWLVASVDNYWLLTAMRYGLVGLVLLAAAFLVHVYQVSVAKITDEETRRFRLGYTIVLAGIIFTIVTVHIWGGLLSLVFMYIGAGRWFTDPTLKLDQEADETAETEIKPVNTRRYTRFADGPPSKTKQSLPTSRYRGPR